MLASLHAMPACVPYRQPRMLGCLQTWAGHHLDKTINATPIAPYAMSVEVADDGFVISGKSNIV